MSKALNSKEWADFYDNGPGSENFKRKIKQAEINNPVKRYCCKDKDDRITELEADLKKMTKSRNSHSKVRQSHLVRHGKACDKIQELKAELETYKAGNVPLHEIIADSEGMALDIEELTTELEGMKELALQGYHCELIDKECLGMKSFIAQALKEKQ